ncbi:sulfotransferase [Thermomonas sp.]|uniref:tetratricopeptide repeat-containing sulfotransferase family protein n=1 Tax=Thermomonas sp. TaxID=1971895 RepID=UPI0024895DE3|nr:sulfotransferase [Thermomonas sp.]MDI1254434.1 sulfotransferase [Thermomonas sp.]
MTTTASVRMAGLGPEDVEVLHAAARAIRDHSPAQAERLLGKILARHPTHAEALRLLAILHLNTRRGALAIQTLQAAISHHPGDALLQCDLGNAHAACGDHAGAINAWEHACVLAPDQVTAWFNLGRAHQQQGESRAAINALQQACALAPDLLPAKILLGDALVHIGRFEDATQQYRDAVRLHPTCGDAWRGLSSIKTVALSDADALLLSTQLQRRDTADSDRIAMGHALGKLQEDRGCYPQAHAALVAANALQRKLTPWRVQDFTDYIEQVLVMTSELPAPIDPELGREAIFIVGLPRSGSTLFEQILAAHPDVEGAGELPDLGNVIQRESRRRQMPFPAWIQQVDAADWHRLGLEYLERTARWRSSKSCFVDKMPENWKLAGVLRAMLPGATVIESRRDPLETAWSCFKQQFYNQPHFACDVGDIAAYLHGCERAMDQWRARDPEHLHLHRYEDLLAGPETGIRTLLADCGLEFDPACLDFHAANRSVRTASAAQVRQPLRGDTARSPHYGALLDPFRHALGLPAS